jgi:hypothetical protein
VRVVDMGNFFKPGKYNMAVCPFCNGRGRLPKNLVALLFAEDVRGLDSSKEKRESLKK